jgi:hypothetical protein
MLTVKVRYNIHALLNSQWRETVASGSGRFTPKDEFLVSNEQEMA